MKRLYEKSEIAFAIMWIVIYVAGMSISDSLSSGTGGGKSAAGLVLLIIMSIFLYRWIGGNQLGNRYGFCAPQKKMADLLFYIPLILAVLLRLTGGFAVNNPKEAVLQFSSMLLVGFMEELIFRGFLFRAMEMDGVRSALIVSAVTFGLGHIVNLVNGSGMSTEENIWQIAFAIIFGFCMVFLFYYGTSLWPCIITHGFFNALGTVTKENSLIHGTVSVPFALQMSLMTAYALYLWYRLKKEKRL